MESSDVIVFGLVLTLILLWISSRKLKNFPSGPIGLPVIGYFPFLEEYPYKTFMKMGEKYGNVFSLPLGPERVVVLNDWSAIKEVLINQTETFNGRPKFVTWKEMTRYFDIIFSDGPGWRQRKRFTLQHFKNVGVGKPAMESVIMDEINDIFDNLTADRNDIVNVNDYFFVPFFNIICSLVGGKKFDQDSEMMLEFTNIIKNLFDEASFTNPLFFIPSLRYIFRQNYEIFLNENSKMESIIRQEIDRHETTYQDGNVRDFIDACLRNIYKNDDSPENVTSLTNDKVIQISKNLFNAGIDTSRSNLLWGLLYMATWPSIQSKVQDELDEVFGRERMPNYADRSLLSIGYKYTDVLCCGLRSRLKYTNAVILEIFRYSSIVPLTPRRTTMESHLLGFTLPKDTVVFLNFWAVHRDPKYWTDPDVFNPERFFNDRGEVEKPEFLIPFGIGGRVCLGESLAKMTSFLFFTCILHRFSVSLPPGVRPPSLDPKYNITLAPKPFSLHFNNR